MTLEIEQRDDTVTASLLFISKKCCKCEKEMCDEDGTTLTGYSLQFYITEDQTESKKAFCKKQLGKYEPNHSYDFCYECWLDSLMGDKL